MDPNATHKLLTDALEDHDADAIIEHGKNLFNWISKGGSLPEEGMIDISQCDSSAVRFLLDNPTCMGMIARVNRKMNK